MNLRELIDCGCIKKSELKAALARPNPEQALEGLTSLGYLRYDAKRELARQDSAAFCGFILRDEETGDPITLASMHHEWHALLAEHKRLVIWSHYEAGKSSEISIGYTLSQLGQDPNKRCVIVSATGDSRGTAGKIAYAIQQHIEQNERLHDVYPHLKPGDRWASTAFDVVRDPLIKDFSVQSIGVHGAITGTRIDLLVLDDILTHENTRIATRRDEVITWIKNSLFTRLTRNAQVVFVGNAWHPDDAMHHFGKRWVYRRYPVKDEQGKILFPAKWDDARIEYMEGEFGSHEAARMLYCQARSDDASRFKDTWFIQARENGRGKMIRNDCTPLKPYEGLPGTRRYTGIDLGIGKKQINARTAIITLESHPDAAQVIPSANPGQRAVELLRARSGKWDAEEIVLNAIEEQRCFGSTLIVEAVAAQRFLARFIKMFADDRVPVIAFSTDKRKHHPQFGVEGLAIGLSQGLWILPAEDDEHLSTHPEVTALIEDMRYYDPAAHTGDHLMAAWMAAEGCAGRAANYALAITDENEMDRIAAQERMRKLTAGITRDAVHPDPEIAADPRERKKLMAESQAAQIWGEIASLAGCEEFDL